MNEVYKEYFPTDPPARRAVQAKLIEDYKIEIDCVALEQECKRPSIKRFLTSRFRFKYLQILDQLFVSFFTITTMMNFPITSRVESSHKSRMIGTAISATKNMVRFKIWQSISFIKRRRITTRFTNTPSPCQHVLFYFSTTLVVNLFRVVFRFLGRN